MTRKFASFVRFSRLNTIMKRTLLLIYFTIIFITSVSAQLYQYLDTNDGLSSRRVLSIQKDNNLKSATIIQYTIKGRFMSR